MVSFTRLSSSTLKHLRLLAQSFPDIPSASGQILHLEMMQALPKGTEYFFSDLHGEDGAFIHLLRSASGNIRSKIRLLYDKLLSEDEQNQLAQLVYNPNRFLNQQKAKDAVNEDWLRITVYRLVELLKFTTAKYARSRVAEKTPKAYAAIIQELLYNKHNAEDENTHADAVLHAVVHSENSLSFIRAICIMIQRVSVDKLHIIGDIFDRGPGPHRIMDALMSYPDVDIQWGNHDVVWMGAACGSRACMANVVRVAIGYNGYDCLEDGYGINLRPLYSFARKVYADDPCSRFTPKLFDENKYSRVDPSISAKINKAMAIIQFKLEGQLFKRRPEFAMEDRIVLEAIDYESMSYVHAGQSYPLLDTHFPTVDPKDPLKLSPEEEEVMHSLHASFTHSEALRRHVDYLFTVGSSYACVNGNLLYHGCIPMTETGELAAASFLGRPLAGKDLMDEIYTTVRKGRYASSDSEAASLGRDLMHYLWCGPMSPMFGKSKMATFENYFIEDKALRKEVYNPYFRVSQEERYCKKILEEFGLDPETSHIINGHVPVKIKDGETPVKAGGKLFVIDGGISKAYQSRTGIAGYTMIYNSHHLALVEHSSFSDIENDPGNYMPTIRVVEEMPERVKIKDTDEGERIRERIADLRHLIHAFKTGQIQGRATPYDMGRDE